MIIPIGHENFVGVEEAVVILNAENASARGLRQEAEKEGKLIDSTGGSKTRSVILLLSGQVVLSSLQSTAIKKKFDKLMRVLSKEKQDLPSSFFDKAQTDKWE